jgi:hypothetical protein
VSVGVHALSTASPDLSAEALAAVTPTDEAPLTVTLFGETFTARKNRPAGAGAAFAARMKGGDRGTMAAAPLLLLQAWIIPEDHDRLLAGIERVDDLEAWGEAEFGKAVEALAERPTPAP